MHLYYSHRRGAMLILVSVALVILIVGAVFSVDIAYMHMIRAELRTATDAAARAGSETLARTQDVAQARAAAVQVASQNRVAGNGLSISSDDVQFGSLLPINNGRFSFVPNVVPFTAVRVQGRREADSLDGSVPLFFARLFSTSQFEPVQAATAAANVRDLALVLDISGSMNERSGRGSRLQALQAAVEVFLDEITASSPSTNVSLVAYSTAPAKLLELTNNYASVRGKISSFNASGWTAIGNALQMGSDSLVNDPLNRSFAFKTIVLMTDGNHNEGPSPTVTVASAVARGQTVHTVTFSNGANQSLMRQVAQATQGGQHLHADDAADLAAVFRTIARTLSVTLIE